MPRKNNEGFTIVELLIVVVVIAILASISVVAYSGIQQRARDTKRVQDINSIAKALKLHYAATGSYPSGIVETSEANFESSAIYAALEPYMAEVPVEPTPGNYFHYLIVGNRSCSGSTEVLTLVAAGRFEGESPDTTDPCNGSNFTSHLWPAFRNGTRGAFVEGYTVVLDRR